MAHENLTYYEPTEEQLAKFHYLNSMSEVEFGSRCEYWNDCSICPIAIHQWLISTEKHTCTYGITEEKFRILMADADCEY